MPDLLRASPEQVVRTEASSGLRGPHHSRPEALDALDQNHPGCLLSRLDRMTGERDPHLRGAHVADVLDMLYDQDAFLGIRETFYAENEALWEASDEEGRLALSVATCAAVVLLELEQDTFWPTFAEPPEAMLPLVKRLAGADR